MAEFTGGGRGEMSLRENEMVTVIEKNNTGLNYFLTLLQFELALNRKLQEISTCMLESVIRILTTIERARWKESRVK